MFKTPLPNPKLWNGPTIGTLASPDVFVNGGWWHDSRILAATGDGLAKEEPRAWSGWWNEKVVELVQLSMRQKDALCVLLTGRSESGFGELVRRMVASRGLEFDLVSLKPAVGPSNQRFSSTMVFKQMFLEALMETYRGAEEIRIYEDRLKHVKGFRDFMTDYNMRQNGLAATRGPIVAEVVPVADMATNLDPVVEVAEVQHLVNAHNQALAKRAHHLRGEKLVIKKTVFYTGYLIGKADTQKLLGLVQLPANLPDADLKVHANNIMICPRPCPQSILDKVGGMGSKMKWEVTGTACFENSIWAACLRPVPVTAKFHTDNPSPLVVLALRKGARPIDAGKIQNWQPVPADRAHVFETTVGEKILLRIEAENPGENAYESLFPNKSAKRRHTENDEPPRFHAGGPYGQARGYHHQSGGYGGRGGGGGNQGGGRGGFRGNGQANRGFRGGGRGGGAGRGRGGGGGGKGKHHYHSLDDVGTREPGQVTYDDSSTGYQPPRQPPKGPKNQHHQHQHQHHQHQPQQQQVLQQQQQQPPPPPPHTAYAQQVFNAGGYGGWNPPVAPQNHPGRHMGGGGAQGYGGGGAELQNYY